MVSPQCGGGPLSGTDLFFLCTDVLPPICLPQRHRTVNTLRVCSNTHTHKHTGGHTKGKEHPGGGDLRPEYLCAWVVFTRDCAFYRVDEWRACVCVCVWVRLKVYCVTADWSAATVCHSELDSPSHSHQLSFYFIWMPWACTGPPVTSAGCGLRNWHAISSP